MEVRKGYKQTDIGVIPDDWNIGTIGDLTNKVGSGITPTGGEKVYKTEGRPFMRSQNVGWGTLLLDDIAFIDEQIHSSFAATEIQLNDVLLNITGASIGRSVVADGRIVGGNVNQHVCIIRPDKNKLSPQYINLFLLSSMGQKQIESFQAGGNRQGLNFGQIKSFLFPLPPFPEQQAIAAALSDVDSLLTALDALIAKKRLIKQGAMQELLTGKKRLPGFSGEWNILELKEIVNQFIVPMRDKPKAFKGDIPWCRIEDFDGKILFGSKSNQNVDNETIKQMNLKVYPTGTLLVSCSADLGRCAIVGRPLVSNQTFIGLVFDEGKASNDYFYYYMSYHADDLNNLSSGTTISYLSREQFETFSVTVPSTKAEQTAIAEILSDMDAEIAALEARREKTRLLKQGMMQELLTGRIRLI